MKGILTNFIAGCSLDVVPAGGADAILVGAPYCLKSETALRNVKNFLDTLQPQYRMVDSGGYETYVIENKKPEIIDIRGKPRIPDKIRISYDPDKPIFQKGIFNITPEHVLKAAIEIKADFLTSPDYPLPKSKIKGVQEYEFRRAAFYNAECAKETSQLWEKFCTEKKLMVPVQAYNLRQFDTFMGLLGTAVLDGFSLPIRAHGIADICLFLVKFYHMGIRYVHILGSAKFWLIAVAAYFAHNNFFDWVSFDACSWRITAEKKIYLEPYTLRSISLKEGSVIDDADIRCQCPWCSYFSSLHEIQDKLYREKVSFLRNHNWWVTNQATTEFYANAATPFGLRNFLLEKSFERKKQIDELYRCLSIVDLYRDAKIQTLEAMLYSL